MMSTIHQRHILAFFEEKKMLSFSELKIQFIETKEMNQTTLYRILERFLETGKIHKAELEWEKYFVLCECHKEQEEGIKLQCCNQCHSIQEQHFPLAPDALRSETVEYLKCCENCKK